MGDPKPNNESSKVGKNYSSARQRENRQIELILNGNNEMENFMEIELLADSDSGIL